MINKPVLICITTFFEHTFMQVGESLPVSDGSMDAVVGTLVLCSVEDVNKTLQGILLSCHIYFFLSRISMID